MITFVRRHNKRPGVDAGRPVLFAFSRACPRATQAGCSPNMQDELAKFDAL